MKFIPVLICGLLLMAACKREFNELRSYPLKQDTVTLTVVRNNVPADNLTYAQVVAVFKNRVQGSDQVVFTTDKGVFSNGSATYTVNVGANDTLNVYLKHSKPEVARVTANLFGRDSREVFVNFITAYPSQILVSADSAALMPVFGSKTSITARLSRPSGSVSEGLQINYYDSAATSSLRSLGVFTNPTLTNAQGISTVDYRLQDTSYHGFVYIKSFINTDTGRVAGQTRILIR